jgi:hypothetical protein
MFGGERRQEQRRPLFEQLDNLLVTFPTETVKVGIEDG